MVGFENIRAGKGRGECEKDISLDSWIGEEKEWDRDEL